MNFWELVASVLASLGGAACIVALTIKFAGNMIAERLSKKYDLQLSKELESIKSTLERKNYISKTRFDTEFQIYRELSKTFFDLIMATNYIAIPNFDNLPEEKIKKYKKDISDADLKIKEAQNTLFENMPFIFKDFHIKYEDILHLCFEQLRTLGNIYIATDSHRVELISQYTQSGKNIKKQIIELNESIREYLFNLGVLE